VSDPLTDTPTAPPAAPVIPVGLGTFVGLGAGTGQWVAAILAAVLNGDHSITTITLIVTGAATVITTLAGRFAQAHAAIKSRAFLPVAQTILGKAGVLPPGENLEFELGQTDPDPELEPHEGDVPPDEGDAEAAEATS
jgi:hypothetical protein